MLPPKNRGTVTYVAPPGHYDVNVSQPRRQLQLLSDGSVLMACVFFCVRTW